MCSQASNSLHQYLKLTTAAAHSNLERVLAARGYFDNLDGYVDYLHRFLAFQEEAERLLEAGRVANIIPDWKERRRTHLARADLRALNLPEAKAMQTSGKLPRLLGLEQVLGVAYVLEGSTLGGAFLLKQLAPLGISASHGGSYLASYGSSRGRMWQRFLVTLEDAHERRVDVECVASAALAAFNAARYYLTEPDLTYSALADAGVAESAAAETGLPEVALTSDARACSMVA